MVLFWIRGKRAEDSEVVVVVVQSRRLKVKIKELFNLERNGASMRERKAVGMRRARDILQSPSGPDRGESHKIWTQQICYRYSADIAYVQEARKIHFSAGAGRRPAGNGRQRLASPPVTIVDFEWERAREGERLKREKAKYRDRECLCVRAVERAREREREVLERESERAGACAILEMVHS